ncbi:MAG: hypothetical protein WAL72_38360 [Streptosporangiaceae bacterium]
MHEERRHIPALDQAGGLERPEDVQPGQRRRQAGGAVHAGEPVLGLGADLLGDDGLSGPGREPGPVLHDRALHAVVRRRRRAGYRDADQGADPLVALGGQDDRRAEGESRQDRPVDVQFVQQVGQVGGVVGQAGPGPQIG